MLIKKTEKIPINLTSEQYQIVSSILSKFKGNFWFFGSRATKNNQPSSDLDICFDNLSLYEQFSLENYFHDSNFPFFVDLVPIKKISSLY
jgi:predicted nucleotidyltransferase